MVVKFGQTRGEDVADLIARKQYAKAIDIIKAQLKAQKNDPRIRLQLADVLVMSGRPAEAVAVLVPLADEYARDGFAAKAIAVLKRIQKIDPRRRDIEARLASVIEEKQRQATVPIAAVPARLEIGFEEIQPGMELGIEPVPDAAIEMAPPAASAPARRPEPLHQVAGAAGPDTTPAPRPPEPPPPLRPPSPAPVEDRDLLTGAEDEPLMLEAEPLVLEPEPTPPPPRRRPAPPPSAPPEPELAIEPELSIEPEAVVVPAPVDAVAEVEPVLEAELDVEPELTVEPELDVEPELAVEPEGALSSERPDDAGGLMGDDLFAQELMSIIEDVFPTDPVNLPATPVLDPTEPAPEAAAACAPSEGGRQIVVSPLFRDFSVDELVAVIQGLRLTCYDAGEIILSEGEPGDSLYMLSAGRVKAFKRNPAGGKQLLLGEMSEGAFFGEISVLTGKPRSATVVAATTCELLELDRATLQQIAGSHPRVWDVMREFAEKRMKAQSG